VDGRLVNIEATEPTGGRGGRGRGGNE
jgi:hypothetical protein